MKLYDLLLKIINKCKITTKRIDSWNIKVYPDKSWEATTTWSEVIQASQWTQWGSVYYATLSRKPFPTGYQNPISTTVNAFEKNGIVWLTCKPSDGPGTGSFFAISPAKPGTVTVNIAVTILEGVLNNFLKNLCLSLRKEVVA